MQMPDGIPFVEAAHYTRGRHEECSLMVIHYTAGGPLDGTVNYFAHPNPARASAHFVVGRHPGTSERFPGGVVQMVRLEDRAHHAGRSEWEGRRGVNGFSVGIELCNWGLLRPTGRGFVTWAGSRYPEEHGEPVFLEGRYWEPFTEFQYRTAAMLCALVMERFPAITPDRIVGHADVSPGRKIDPGPAFDWDRFRRTLGTILEEGDS